MLVGARDNETESTYYAKGDVSKDETNTHNTTHSTGTFHNYTIEGTARAITWSIDGNEVREVEPGLGDSGDSCPQTPMQVRFGCWIISRKETPKEVRE
jgi:beta-glucanase (GH16 family)